MKNSEASLNTVRREEKKFKILAKMNRKFRRYDVK